jgi:hypothetical protein
MGVWEKMRKTVSGAPEKSIYAAARHNREEMLFALETVSNYPKSIKGIADR